MTFTKENAKEEGRKGGKKSTLSKRLAKRKYCTPECPLWDKCPLMPMAQSQWIVKPHGERAHPCLLNTLPPDVQRRMKRLFLSGRDGLIEELKEVIYNYSLLAEKSPEKNLIKYGELILKAISTIYGQKIQEEGNLEVNIKIQVIGEDGEELENP